VKPNRQQPTADPFVSSDPVAVEEWKQVVAAAADRDALASAWSDLNALSATAQVVEADRDALEQLWQDRKAKVMAAGDWPEVKKPADAESAA
jgi:hypothetical protein